TADEVAEMGRLAVEGVQAGAFGFTTSRTEKHRAADGRFTPSLTADEDELLGIARALGAAGVGVLQANIDYGAPEDWALLRAMAEVSRRPTWFSLLQVDEHPDRWRELLDEVARANADGLTMRAQVGSRAIGVMFGFDATVNPFLTHPTYLAIAGLPLAERVARLRRPEVREQLLSEQADGGFAAFMAKALDRTFVLGDPPDYEPHPDDNLVAQARRAGLDPHEVLLDALLEDEGRALLYFPFENYSEGSLDGIREMLLDPNTVSGLSDGGAHVGTICDASYPTTLLTHWVRDRTRGERLPLEHVVHRQTQASARAVGLLDRGALQAGLRADVNLVDLEGLTLHAPRMVHDLPAGGKRLVQRADGYRRTFVAGAEVVVDGEWTGATPGRLVRGPQSPTA
ncbi:amidohydrolase, partial [cyanobacterium TDX16]